MFKLLVTVGIVFILVLIAEYLYRIKRYHNELTRKFVHMTVGSFAAFWPWFLTWRQIELLSLIFLVAVIIARLLTLLGTTHVVSHWIMKTISKRLTIVDSIYLIGRKTVGEIFFSIAIGLTALISHNQYIFMAALLHLSVADGLAAIAGTYLGERTRYRVFGQLKSAIGSEVFYLSSFIILSCYFAFSHAPGALPTLLWLPVATTFVEIIGIHGSDNLLLPVVVAAVLRLT